MGSRAPTISKGTHHPTGFLGAHTLPADNVTLARQRERGRWTVCPPRWSRQEPGLRRGMAQAGLLAEDQACQPIIRPDQQQPGQPTTRLPGIGRRAKVLNGSHLERSALPQRLFQESFLERTATPCFRTTATHSPPQDFQDTLSCPHSTRPHPAGQGWRNIWRNLVL